MKPKLLLIPVMFLLVMGTVFSVVVIQNYPIKNNNWSYDALFVEPNIIIINGYENEYHYKEMLVHEYAHYTCKELFDDWYCNDADWKQEHDDYIIKI